MEKQVLSFVLKDTNNIIFFEYFRSDTQMNGNLILITFIKIDLMLLNILAVCVCVLSIHLIYQNSKQEDMFSRLINPSYSFHIKLSIENFTNPSRGAAEFTPNF
jgi:hypothetical protein